MDDLCGKVAADIIGADCGDISVPGLYSEAYIINKNDIDEGVTVIDANNMITTLALKTGKYAYLLKSLNRGLSASQALQKAKYGSGYDHKVMLRLFDINPYLKMQIDQLEKGKYIIIAKNYFLKNNATSPEKVGMTSWEAYGFHTGLEALTITRATDDVELKGGYMVEMGTHPDEPDNFMPLTVWLSTTLALTETALAGLLTPPTP